MKYLVTLKRKQTTNASQNARLKRVDVDAIDNDDAGHKALIQDQNYKYFNVESVRRA